MTTDKKANKTSQSIFSNLFSDNTAKQATNKANQTDVSSSHSENSSPSISVQTKVQSVASPQPAVEPQKPKEIRTYDVSIAGSTYPINCPVDEKEDLDKAVLYINHFIREIRKDAPTLGHENILVLCCLNMYEEMNQEKNTQANLQQKDKQMQALIEKITKDAKSILN